MNRNTELHYSHTPEINIKRSKFDRSYSHKTTVNAADIVPMYWDEILPGDTVQMDMAELVRMLTPIAPVMDNLFMDIYFFFVPNRLLWEHHAQFWGENDNPWTQETEYEIPQITAPEGGWKTGTIADYMGIPINVGGKSVTALPFRAYCKIYNDWFKNENTNTSLHMYTDETTRTGKNGDEQDYDPITDTELGGQPVKAAKFHDYFTSCLPSPQRGPEVTIPMGQVAPIKGVLTSTMQPSRVGQGRIQSETDIWSPHPDYATSKKIYLNGISLNDQQARQLYVYKDYTQGYPRIDTPKGTETIGTQPPIPDKLQFNNLYGEGHETTYDLSGLYAEMSEATATSISNLRTAFAIQKYYENAGLHGTRYIEYIRSVFGVTSSDARMQRAEYVGGQRFPLNMDQILQTSATNDVTPQGNTAGFSCTINQDHMFTKSFEEHGILMGLCVIRPEHTYQQGLDKKWTRKKWVDFFNPFFQNISEQPVYVEELYCTGTEHDREAFGYQEAWADYRTATNKTSGFLRSTADGSLDFWHYGDYYTSQPYLSQGWMEETVENIDRTIAVTSQHGKLQFLADFFFKQYWTRPMPVYSVPGLIDHV